MFNSLLYEGVKSERAKFGRKFFREFEFVIDEKKYIIVELRHEIFAF